MKEILLISKEVILTIKVNWLEYLMLKRILKQKRYAWSKIVMKGDKVSSIIYDEGFDMTGGLKV